MDWNNLNDLNNPPGEESTGKWVSRLARELLVPVLVPLSTAFIGWLAQRRVSDQLREVQREKEKVAEMKAKMEFPQVVVGGRGKMSGATMTLAEITERRHLAEAAITSEEAAVTEEILSSLDELRPLLSRRQNIYCDMFTHRTHRHQIEAELKHRASTVPYAKEMGLDGGMLDIFENDTNCSAGGKGSLMRSYMLFWKTKAQMLKYKRVVERTQQIIVMPTTKPVD